MCEAVAAARRVPGKNGDEESQERRREKSAAGGAGTASQRAKKGWWRGGVATRRRGRRRRDREEATTVEHAYSCLLSNRLGAHGKACGSEDGSPRAEQIQHHDGEECPPRFLQDGVTAWVSSEWNQVATQIAPSHLIFFFFMKNLCIYLI